MELNHKIYGSIIEAIKTQNWMSLCNCYSDFNNQYHEWSLVIEEDFEGYVKVEKTDCSGESRDGMRSAISTTYTTTEWRQIPSRAFWEQAKTKKRIGIVKNKKMGLDAPLPNEFPSCDIEYVLNILKEYTDLNDNWIAGTEERARNNEKQMKVKALVSFIDQKLDNLTRGSKLSYSVRYTNLMGENIVFLVKETQTPEELLREEINAFNVVPSDFWQEKEVIINRTVSNRILERTKFFVELENENKVRAEKEKIEKHEKEELKVLLKRSKERRKTGIIGKKEEITRLILLAQKYPNIY
jgi:hypothetical protein